MPSRIVSDGEIDFGDTRLLPLESRDRAIRTAASAVSG